MLSQAAGVAYRHPATSTAGDITMAVAITTITAKTRRWILFPGDDALLCGLCAVTQWLRAMELMTTRPSNREPA